MYSRFPLFQSHLDLAHAYWSTLIIPGDCIIDATCGNGYDALILSQLALTDHSGELHALDIQLEALNSTRLRLANHLSTGQLARVHLHQSCHSHFPSTLSSGSVKLIVYNLGYLPGTSKIITTRVETTLESLRTAQTLICLGGGISITCYPGHSEGAREQTALVEYLSQLSPTEWSVCHHCWLNRRQAPSLILLQRKANQCTITEQ